MSLLNKQIDAYLEQQDLKNHQKRTLEILNAQTVSDGSVLELGSASGKMLPFLAKIFPDRQITGLEISRQLHNLAVEDTKSYNNVHHICEDLKKFTPSESYAAIVAEGVHSIFDDPEQEILKWMSWLKPGGVAVIFGMFSKANFDFRFYYKNLENDQGWEAGLNGVSIKTLSTLLDQEACSYTFEPFKLDFELEKTENPIRSYTEDIGGIRSLIVGDALITHMYHLIIEKNKPKDRQKDN